MKSILGQIVILFTAFYAVSGSAARFDQQACLRDLKKQVAADLSASKQAFESLFDNHLDNSQQHQVRYSRILLGIINALAIGKITPVSSKLRPPYPGFPELAALTLDERVTASEILNDHMRFGGRQSLAEAALSQYRKIIFDNPLLAFIQTPDARDLVAAKRNFLSALALQGQSLDQVPENSMYAGALTLFSQSLNDFLQSQPNCMSGLQDAQQNYLALAQRRPPSVTTMAIAAGSCGALAFFSDGIFAVVCGGPSFLGLGYSLNASIQSSHEQTILAALLLSRQLANNPDTEMEKLLRYLAFTETALMSLGIPRRSGPL